MIKRLDKIESSINLIYGDAPIVHQIVVPADKTRKQCLMEYEAEHNIKIKSPDSILYLLIYPDYFSYKEVKYIRENEKLVESLLKEGKTLKEILDNATE